MSTFLDNRPPLSVLEDFRKRLNRSAEIESQDVAGILAHVDSLREGLDFSAELIPLNDVEKWSADPITGDIRHASGRFFGLSGMRTHASSIREVTSWDQPILTQTEGGVLALFSRDQNGVVEFLLQVKAESGNIGYLQLSPTVQSTWSNLNRAHDGRNPILSEGIYGDMPGQLIYAAKHNEEGGRFWRKSNLNCIIECSEPAWLEERINPHFVWASLSQIKALALVDNVLNPFVKTIIAPL